MTVKFSFYLVLFCLSGFSLRFTNFRTFISLVLSLTTLPTRCLFILALSLPAVFSMHLLYYSLVVFLSSAFFISPPHSVLASLTAIPHHTTPPVNSTHTSTVPLSLRLVVHSLTLPSLPQSLSSFVCSFVRRH